MSRLISLSGSICVGKTATTRCLATINPHFTVLPEFVEPLQFLPLFYQEPRRFALHSRLELLLLKVRQTLAAPGTDQTIIIDRAAPELIVFADTLHEQGIFSPIEYVLYKQIYDTLLHFTPTIDYVVWLRADVSTQLSRIAERGRPFELNITAEYLTALDSAYCQWFAQIPEDHRLSINTSAIDVATTTALITNWLRCLP